MQISSVVRTEEAFDDGSMLFLLSNPSSDLQEVFMKSVAVTGAVFRRVKRAN